MELFPGEERLVRGIPVILPARPGRTQHRQQSDYARQPAVYVDQHGHPLLAAPVHPRSVSVSGHRPRSPTNIITIKTAMGDDNSDWDPRDRSPVRRKPRGRGKSKERHHRRDSSASDASSHSRELRRRSRERRKSKERRELSRARRELSKERAREQSRERRWELSRERRRELSRERRREARRAEREMERDKEREKEREKERGKEREKEREKEYEKLKEKEKEREWLKQKEKEYEKLREKEKEREKEKARKPPLDPEIERQLKKLREIEDREKEKALEEAWKKKYESNPELDKKLKKLRDLEKKEEEVERRRKFAEEEALKKAQEDAMKKKEEEFKKAAIEEFNRKKAEKEAKEKKEKEEADKAFKERVKATFGPLGYSQERIEKILEKESNPNAGSTKLLEFNRPRYIKVHRKHLSQDTLDAYDLPWELDDKDQNYLIIKRWIPEAEQDVLFEHSRKLREGRLLANAPKKDRENQLLLVRKKVPGRTRSVNRRSWILT